MDLSMWIVRAIVSWTAASSSEGTHPCPQGDSPSDPDFEAAQILLVAPHKKRPPAKDE